MTGMPRIININFASRNYRLTTAVYTGLLAASALFVALMVVMFVKVFIYRHDVAAMDRKLAELETSVEKFKPVMRERQQLVSDLSDMSGLMESKRFSWTQLLTAIETIFPTGVALEHIGYNPKSRSLSLKGRARTPESLRNLIVGMEQSPSFKAPLLKHQSVDKGHISFEVVAHYEDRGAGMVQ